MEPAQTIIGKLGGPTAVSALLGLERSTVWKWQRSRDEKGTGGLIPIRHIRPLLDAARAQDIPLTAADFLPAEAPEKRPRRRRRAA